MRSWHDFGGAAEYMRGRSAPLTPRSFVLLIRHRSRPKRWRGHVCSVTFGPRESSPRCRGPFPNNSSPNGSGTPRPPARSPSPSASTCSRSPRCSGRISASRRTPPVSPSPLSPSDGHAEILSILTALGKSGRTEYAWGLVSCAVHGLLRRPSAPHAERRAVGLRVRSAGAGIHHLASVVFAPPVD
jgi:hypothetical protein